MIRVLGVPVVTILVLSGCGGGAAPTTTAPTVGANTVATAAASEVTVQGFAFKPASVEVKVGTKLTWTNKDGTTHTTTSGTPGAKDGKWDSQLSASGGTFSFTFAQAGTFAYFCSIHPTITGTVIVK